MLPVEATTYHVSQQGNDSTTCAAAQSAGSARRTINGGIACLGSGDTLLIGPGTYNEPLSDIGGPPGYHVVPIPAGSLGAPTTIKAAQPGTVTLRSEARGSDRSAIITCETGACAHIRFEGLRLDAEQQRHGMSYGVNTGDSSHHVQFVNLEIVGADNGIAGTGSDHQVIGGHIHSMGKPHCYSGDPDGPGYCHGIYTQYGGAASQGRWVIDGVTFSGNSGFGVHAYGDPHIIVRNSVFREHYIGGVVIIGPGGTVTNNCFERNPEAIGCPYAPHCRQEGNRIDPPGGCGGAVPSREGPAPLPAPYNLRVVVVP